MTVDDLDVETEWKRFYEWFHLFNQRTFENEERSICLTPETETAGIAMGYKPVPGRWRLWVPFYSDKGAYEHVHFKLAHEYSVEQYVGRYNLEYPDQFPWPYELVDAFAMCGLLYRSKFQEGICPVVQIFLTVDGGDLAKDNV